MRTLVLAALLCAPAVALADYEDKIAGDWVLSATTDRFGDGGTYAAGSVAGGFAFFVRCIQRRPSFAIVDVGRDFGWAPGSEFTVELRSGQLRVFELSARAIAKDVIGMPAPPDVIRNIRDSQETAVRLKGDGMVTTTVFKTRGAPEALADVVKECPLE